MVDSKDDPANDPVNPQPQLSSKNPHPQDDPANDPVYSQLQKSPQKLNEAPAAHPDGVQAKDKSSNDPANDPVYSQPQGSSQRQNENSTAHASNSDADDPVYSQPQASPESSADSIKKLSLNDPADDPVYSQPQASPNRSDAKSTASVNDPADDPVYSQPQASTNRSDIKPTASINDPANDPVYSQPQASRDKSVVRSSTSSGNDPANDPVYSQPQASPNRSDVKSTASINDPANDPVYSQPQASPQGSDHTLKTASEDTSSESQNDKAASRLDQVSSHINPMQKEPQSNTKRLRRKPKTQKQRENELPEDYSDVLDQISTMKKMTSTPDPKNRGYARQKTSGKLWARERIAQLLDPDTFRENGSITGTTVWEKSPTQPRSEIVKGFTPTNNPQGFGQITCPVTGQKREIYLTADDFTVRAGHADGSNHQKTMNGEKLALRMKVPVVKLVDGSSGGGSVTTIKTQGFSYIPFMEIIQPVVAQLNAGIPNLGAVLGPAIGLGAARVVSTHFSVMAADIGSLFNAGPKVVEGATFEEGLTFQDLGGPNVHCRNGTIDNLAADEAGCFTQLKTVLGFLPNCGDLQSPPSLPPLWSNDPITRTDPSLRTIVPRKKARMYNPRTIITSIVDRTSWFEIGPLWGTTAIVGLARMGGHPVGIISNNCESSTGGALDAAGSQKITRHLKFCDVFNLPVVQLVDVPGYAIGTKAEADATMKWGVELAKAYYSTTIPMFSVIVRRCFGVAGGIMLDCRDPVFRVAWPSAQWGSLPLEGGIEVGHRHELNEIRKEKGEQGWKARYDELETEYLRLMNPVRTANAFGIEEIVDPKDTRGIACRWVEGIYGVTMQERLSDRAVGKIRPVFT